MGRIVRLASVFVLLCAIGGTAVADEQALTAVGTISVADVYLAYVAIGAVADAWAYDTHKETYTDETVRDLMSVVHDLTSSSKASLEALLAAAELSDEDVAGVTRLITAYGLLARESEGLVLRLETGDATDFDNYRHQAWMVIAELYGLPADSSESETAWREF